MEWSFEIDDGPSERKPSLVRESSSSSLPLTVTEKLNQEPPKQNPFLVRSPGRSDSDEPRIVMSKIRANIAQPVHVETPISPTLLPKSPPPQCPLSPVIGSPVLRTKSPLNYPSSPPVSPKGIAVRPRCHSPPVSTARVPLSPPLRPKPQVDSFFEEASEVDNGSDKRKLATSAGNWALPSPSISRKPNDQRATGSRSKHTLSPGPGISQFFGFGSSDRKKNRQVCFIAMFSFFFDGSFGFLFFIDVFFFFFFRIQDPKNKILQTPPTERICAMAWYYYYYYYYFFFFFLNNRWTLCCCLTLYVVRGHPNNAYIAERGVLFY